MDSQISQSTKDILYDEVVLGMTLLQYLLHASNHLGGLLLEDAIDIIVGDSPKHSTRLSLKVGIFNVLLGKHEFNHMFKSLGDRSTFAG